MGVAAPIALDVSRNVPAPASFHVLGVRVDAVQIPDVIWVGLSTPRQERRMAEFRARLTGAVMVGVGAAFDLHTERVRQAPGWMREHGLEWLWRLLMEPRRLWRRAVSEPISPQKRGDRRRNSWMAWGGRRFEPS